MVNFPYFTIEDAAAGIAYYREHCGLRRNSAYRCPSEEERLWYREHGILLLEHGAGQMGNVIVTRDQPDGGIDSAVISALIAKIGGR